MAWFAELAGKAEDLLNNLDEQTGAALKNRNAAKVKKRDLLHNQDANTPMLKRKPPARPMNRRTDSPEPPIRHVSPTRQPSPNKMLPKKPNTYQHEHEPHALHMDMPNLMRNHSENSVNIAAGLLGRNNKSLINVVEGLEIENNLLRNEIENLGQEMSVATDKLDKVSNGENVVRETKELAVTQDKLKDTEKKNADLFALNKSLSHQLDQLRSHVDNVLTEENRNYKKKVEDMDLELNILKRKNSEFIQEINELKGQYEVKENAITKVEGDLNQAQAKINTLTGDLEKSNAECKRLEKDWENYKLRVKSMLSGKDKEIKALQDGVDLSEDTKTLLQQIENLKEEREDLKDVLGQLRGKCEDLKQYVSTLETRHVAADRTVSALRDALKDERAARNRVEAQFSALNKEIKNIQLEANQTIAALRTRLRERDLELEQLRETPSDRTWETGGLNVADYATVVSGQSERVLHLTEKLVQRQSRIDALIADNNTLRIQLQNIENKFKKHLAASKSSVSVVKLHDESRPRLINRMQNSDSMLTKISRRMGIWMRQYALFRAFIIVYIAILQVWVLALLFASTPENRGKFFDAVKNFNVDKFNKAMTQHI